MTGGAVYSLVVITVAVTIAMVLLPDTANDTAVPAAAPAKPPKAKPAPKPPPPKSNKRRADEDSASVLAPVPGEENDGLFASSPLKKAAPAAAAPLPVWALLGGLAVDEGGAIGKDAVRNCDLACCYAACEADPGCHSVSHREDRKMCYLKDACLGPDSPVRDGKHTYQSYYLPCGGEQGLQAAGDVVPIDPALLEALDAPEYVRGPIEWLSHPAVQVMRPPPPSSSSPSSPDTCLLPRCGAGSTDLGTWIHPQVFQPFYCCVMVLSSCLE
jgi:hypothetical protein